MKRLANYITICILLLTVSAAAQLPRPRILEAFSQNKRYKLTYTTTYIDTLLTKNMTDGSGKVIWEKEIPFEGPGVVSNLGEFIIFLYIKAGSASWQNFYTMPAFLKSR